MLVKILTCSEEALEERDYRDALVIEVDGEVVFSVYDGEPEDNSLGRNFNDVMNIDILMKLAYNAGIRGESLEISWEQRDDI